MLTGALIGYARVSTREQLLDRQLRALTAVGCTRTFTDKLSGRTADRPELTRCLDYLRAGDTLVVPSLDRLSRSLQDLITLVAELRRRGVGFRSLHEALDTTTPGGRLVFHVFAALAEFIRELIVEGTREGLDAARARGTRLGRPPALTGEQIEHARHLLTHPDNTVASIARLLGVSRATLYAHVPELARGPALPDAEPQAGHLLPGAHTSLPGAGDPPADVDPPAGVDEDQADTEQQTGAVDPTTTPFHEPAPAAGRGVQPHAGARTVDLSAELDAPAGTWQLVDAGEGGWHLHRDGTRVGVVRRESTTRGRRGWSARLDTGVPLPAHGDLATAAGSTLWRSRDLAAAAIARGSAPRAPRRGGRG